MRRPSLIAIIALTVLFVGAALPAQAANPIGEDGVLVVLIDQGASPVQRDLDTAESIAFTMVRGTDAGTIGAGTYGVQISELSSASTGPEGTRLVGDVVTELRELPVGPASSDQIAALTDAFAFMTRIDAQAGSRVAFMTTGRILGESENTRDRLNNVADLFSAQDWVIDVVTLPSTEAPMRDLMSDLAFGTDGKFYDAGTAEGINAVIKDFVGLDLTTQMDVEMHDNSAAIVNLDIAPHTNVFSSVFVRQHQDVDVAVFSPSGTRAGDEMQNVEINETPTTVHVRIYSPVPGNWTLQGIGPASKLVASVQIESPLELRLIEQPPVPVGEPAIIEAAAFNGDSAQLLTGAQIEATISKASGTTEVVVLNDSGENGDRLANDGVYSVQLTAPKAQGINDVQLELSWADYGATLMSGNAYRSESFPTINLVEVADIETHLGKYGRIGRVQVMIGDYPYLTDPADVSAILTGENGQLSAAVFPTHEPEPGKAWEFDISAIVPNSGDYELEVTLAGEYQGRRYTRVTPTASMTAVITEEPVRIIGLPIPALAAIGGVFVALAIVLIWSFSKSTPYGYIVDDQGRVIVDFARMKRSYMRRFVARNVVNATEARELPFEGGSFKFGKNKVTLVNKPVAGDPSLRVNSRPAGPTIELEEDVQLGVGGRLLSFSIQATRRVNNNLPSEEVKADDNPRVVPNNSIGGPSPSAGD
jgi:hypothetical protein